MMLWTVCIAVVILGFNAETEDDFYRWGPNDTLVVFGCPIDTWQRYCCIVAYSFINTGCRTLQHNVVQPFITLNVQDNTVEGMERKRRIRHSDAYEMSLFLAVYGWFDWFIYMNLLLVQIDMVVVEASTDVVVTACITWWYMRLTHPFAEEEPLLQRGYGSTLDI